MELSSAVFSNILTPLAAFPKPYNPEQPADVPENTCYSGCYSSCEPTTSRRQITWRLDGIDTDGARFFAIPTFAIDAPPLRIDVYIPPIEEHPKALRSYLNSDAAIYTVDTHEARELPISQYLLYALSHWSSTAPSFEELYLSLPFGSQVLVSELTWDPTAAFIHLVPNYAVEQGMPSLEYLWDMWPSDMKWPEVIDSTDLRFHSQPHEAITLVHIPRIDTNSSHLFVFKSLVRDQRYLYNELKMLLSLPTHPNIISGPLYIVTQKCRFGGKHGVAGFVLEYYPLGSLARHLACMPSVPLRDRFRWAKQITRALIHINSSLEFGFYPDLKPDNIVLKENVGSGEIDAVLLDLEQRGGWFSWSPPEVAYVEYMEVLATRAPEEECREEAEGFLRRYIPGWTPAGQDEKYRNADGGFSEPWLALVREKRRGRSLKTLLEKAQVFMLGKLLWCIFEGRAVVRCGIDHEILRDPDPDFDATAAFPHFRTTPTAVRNLIKSCTLGEPKWEGRKRGIVLRKGKLVPAAWSGQRSEPTSEEVQETVRRWWEAELNAAKGFMQEITGTGATNTKTNELGNVLKAALSRPLLGEVLEELERIGKGF